MAARADKKGRACCSARYLTNACGSCGKRRKGALKRLLQKCGGRNRNIFIENEWDDESEK